MTNKIDSGISNGAGCIFCKIINKEIPAEIVYENDDFLALLSIEPLSPGHTLVIPKKHYRWVWDVPAVALAKEGEPNIGKYFEIAQKIALAQKKAFDTDFVLSKIIGEEVPHAHIWVYPDNKVKGDKKDFAGNAEKIRNNLK
jgi:histidine triad (HIT) family protein